MRNGCFPTMVSATAASGGGTPTMGSGWAIPNLTKGRPG